ncbi:hypothetical protein Tco_0008859 [Tanacetum coccineum]
MLNITLSPAVEFLCLSTLNEQFKDIKSTIIVASMVDEIIEVAELNKQIEEEISYTRDEEGSTHDSTVLLHLLPPPPPLPVGGNAYLQVRVASITVLPHLFPPPPPLPVGGNAYLQFAQNYKGKSRHVKQPEPPLQKKPVAYSASYKGLQLLKRLSAQEIASQSRNQNRPQQQAPPVVVEPFNFEEPFDMAANGAGGAGPPPAGGGGLPVPDLHTMRS